MTRLASLALLCVAVWTSGCATLVRGNTDTVTVDADRDSAYVFVDGVPAGITPARLEMKRSRNHAVEVVREGFRVEGADVVRKFNSAAGAGALLGGLGGMLIDATTGAAYDLEPGRLLFTLVPDSTGADAERIARLVRQGQLAAESGFAEADPNRRRPPPWLTIQSAVGGFVGKARDSERGRRETTGGLAGSLAVGARTESASARVRGVIGGGLFGGERWQVAALLGLVTETDDGRMRFGLAAGPGLSGGYVASCAFGCGSVARERGRIPTRVSVAAEADAFLFITPQLGVGVQVPADFRLSDPAAGVLIGIRFEGL